MELGTDLTGYQIGKLQHAFGLDYSKKPYRNYYYCSERNNEWDDMCRKGYAYLNIQREKEFVYVGTLEGLRTVFRKNVTRKYFESI
ncbi:hypothetical protein CHCC20441_2438 [Bacillus licheniformis]|uniref:hypothetical protein n=1 Tax=Bacillus subtilis group TaxID=653685 RepID=UPI0011AA3B1E|nr:MULTISPECIES: hypothetical protein [Bacillus subtilis group]MCJ8221413.1 hypothetical protein [Bacillus paralicheniformis]TWK09570.1 hypothetical protein CHCC20441_2438 [Bacillus licheniformis]